jgi:hypothetical protein
MPSSFYHSFSEFGCKGTKYSEEKQIYGVFFIEKSRYSQIDLLPL